MDQERWSQSSVSEAPEAATSAVRRAEDGAGPPVPEAPPRATLQGGGDYLLRWVERNPLTAVMICGAAGFLLSLPSRRG